jgi:hypothetical protein
MSSLFTIAKVQPTPAVVLATCVNGMKRGGRHEDARTGAGGTTE